MKADRVVLGSALLLLLLKLWLVRGDEIIAVYNPWDQLRYVGMAHEIGAGRWLGAYDQATFIRSPGYPAWIALVGAFGVPLRLAVELLLALATLALALVAVRAGVSSWSAAVASAFVVLAPYSFVIGNQVLCETLYAPVTLLSVAAAALPWTGGGAPRRRLGILVWSLALALLWHVRPERLLVLASVATVVAIEAVWTPPGARRGVRGAAMRGLPPLLAIALSSLALRGANLVVYGAAVEQDLLSSSFADAQGALLRIDVPSHRRYVSVPEAARRLAYAASPSFARLEPLLEGQVKQQWTIAGCASLAVCDDYANGWFLFAVREAAARVGVHHDATTADAFYAGVAREIGAACSAHAIPCRRGRPAYVDPRLLDLLPAAFARVAPRLVLSGPGVDPMSVRLPVPDWVARTFDEVALRRTALPAWGTLEVTGWAFGEDGAPVRAVRLEDAASRRLAETAGLLPRADVSAAFAHERVPAPPLNGYSFVAPKQRSAPELRGARLVFTLASGREVTVPLQPDDGTGPVRFSIDLARETATTEDGATRLREGIAQVHPFALLAGALAIALLLSLRLAAPRTLLPRGPLGALVWLCVVTIGLRLAFFTAVEAFLFPCDTRYLYPVMGLSGAAVCFALDGLRRR